MSDADEALALDPTYAKAHHLKGLAYIATKKWKLAKKCFQASLKIEPKSKASKKKLKYWLQEIKKKRQAFAKALETEAPDSLAVASSLDNKGNMLYDQDDLSSTLDHSRRCLAIQEVPEPPSESMNADEPKVSASQPTAESAPPMPPDSDALRATGNECVRCVCTLAIEFQHSFKSRVHVCVVLLLLFGGFVFVVAVLLLWNLSQTPQKQ